MTDRIERIRQEFDRERANPPVPRKADDIPVSYEAITAEWLTAVLCAHQPGATVSDFQLGPPDSGTANRRRIHLTYAGDADGLPQSVFCKASHDLANRIILSNGGALSEVAFYNKVRARVGLDAPRALHAAYDPVSYNSMIVLHDMEDEVAFCDETTPVNLEMARSQMRLLGELHGQFFESPLFTDELSEVLTWPWRSRNMIAHHDLEACCTNGFRAARDVIPGRLFEHESEIWGATLSSIARHDVLPTTLLHGDVHLKNWYRRGPESMGLSDWQTMCRGHWSRDLAYTISTALSVEHRRAWERELIAEYLSALAAHGGPTVTFDEAWLNYRQQLFGALAWWTQTLRPSATMPDMQPAETSITFIGRIATAIDDLDALSSFAD